MPKIVSENLDHWKTGWVYDRTMQAKDKRLRQQQIMRTLGFEPEETWSSDPP